MNKTTTWILSVALAGAVGLGGYTYLSGTEVLAQDGNGQNNGQFQRRAQQQNTNGQAVDGDMLATVAVQPASAALGSVSAAGNIALVSQRSVALGTTGVVNNLFVEAGDYVEAGETLLTLATSDLDRAVRNAELNVASIQNQIEQIMEPADLTEIALAEAELKQAQEALDDVMAGPSEEEIAAAQSNLSSAWAKYNELQAGPSQAELTQLSANLEKSEVSLAEAQREYDQIAWRNDAGATAQAAALQSATIDYEATKAAYEQSIAAADTSELQSALSSAQSAQVQLDGLLNSPTNAEIATAQASVIEAQSNLDELLAGATDSEIESLEISLEQALLNLEEAHSTLASATIVAPIAGTILDVDINLGERYTEGEVVAKIADTSQLELTIDVAEVDIAKIASGQLATIEIDALTGQNFSGEVEQIAPASDDSASIVSYPVTIRLDDASLDAILPGMTAVATIVDNAQASSGWLVPTNAIRQQGERSFVTMVTAEGASQVDVNPSTVRGEWTVVESEELQAGVQVQGSLTSFIADEETSERRPGGGMMGGGAGRAMTGGGRP
ncbi:MAG: efflux RND transporter periplasmic adaptor subunit [Chloroflexota bacterium]